MKKSITLLFTLLAIGYITLTGYKKGAATHGFDCTGAEIGSGNAVGCFSGGSGCHATTPTSAIAVSIELDSAGIATTRYVPNMVYTVKIKGVNNGSTSQPTFGFQLTCIKDTLATATPINAGSWITGNLPTYTHYMAAGASYLANIIEQSSPTAATTGNGGNGSTYTRLINWQAPAAGTGLVSFWGIINAVNNNGSAGTNDYWNNAKLVVAERICSQPTYSNVSQSACSYYSWLGNYFTASGNYSVVTTNHFNCDSIIALSLTILKPSFDTILQAVCKNDSFTFFNSTYHTSGTYMHHLTNHIGCDSLVVLKLMVNPVNKGISVNGNTLNAALNTTYQWIDCQNNNQAIAGANQQSFTPTITGSYAAALINNGCADTSFCYTITITGVEAIDKLNAMVVYPNPATDKLMIKNEALGIEKIEIMDRVGHKMNINISPLNTYDLQLDIDDFPSGIYFVKATYKNGTVANSKWVKQ